MLTTEDILLILLFILGFIVIPTSLFLLIS